MAIVGMALTLVGCWKSEATPDSQSPSHEAPRFEDQTAALGLHIPAATRTYDLCAGVAFVDWDLDGAADIFVTDEIGTSTLWRNSGGPTPSFEDVTEAAGLLALGPGSAFSCVLAADLVGDTAPDLLLIGPEDASFVLLEGRSGAAYVDVSSTHVDAPRARYYGAAAEDIDGDGDLDVALARFRARSPTPRQGECRGLILLENDFGILRDATPDAVPSDGGCSLVSMFTDFDEDGDVDLVQINDYGPLFGGNVPLVNGGLDDKGRFQCSVAKAGSGLAARVYGMGMAVGDINGDGERDYFITSLGDDALLIGLGQGRYEDATATWGAGAPLGERGRRFKWGTVIADLDSDGRDDIVTAAVNGGPQNSAPKDVGAGGLAPWSDTLQERSILLWNSGEPPLEDVTEAAGLGRLDTALGLAAGDIDHDGRVDLLVGALDAVRLYRNVGPRGRWLEVVLRGTVSNSAAIGARVHARCGEVSCLREVGASGSLGSTSEAAVHLGLGACPGPAQVEVRWPSGWVETHEIVELDRRITLEEPRWLALSATSAPADGATTVTVTVRSAPGADAPVVRVHGDHGLSDPLPLEPVGGVWEGALVAPATPGQSAVTVDGFPAAARVRWTAAQNVGWAVWPSNAPSGAALRVGAQLPGVDGELGLEVTSAETAGVEAVEGGFQAIVTPAAGAVSTILQATVDGVPYGAPRVLTITPGVDALASQFSLSPTWLGPADSSVRLYVWPRDATGFDSIGIDATAIEVLADGAPLTPGIDFEQLGSSFFAEVPAGRFDPPTRLTVRVGEVTLSQAATLRSVVGGDARMPLDTGQSTFVFLDRAGSSGVDAIVPLVFALLDKDGQRVTLPALDQLVFETEGCERVDAPIQPGGGSFFDFTVHMRLTAGPGELARARLLLEGSPTLEATLPLRAIAPTPPALEWTEIDVVDATNGDPTALHPGGDDILLRLRPQTENGTLAGSGYGLSAMAAHLEADPLRHIGYGWYELRLTPPESECRAELRLTHSYTDTVLVIPLEFPAGATAPCGP